MIAVKSRLFWDNSNSKSHRVPIPSLIYKKSFKTDVCSWKQKERQNQIMKIYASGNVHFVYRTSLIFDVIGCLYPKDQE